MASDEFNPIPQTAPAPFSGPFTIEKHEVRDAEWWVVDGAGRIVPDDALLALLNRSPAGLTAWVPVSERLPSVGADVLTLNPHGEIRSDVFDEFPEDGFDGNPTTLRWFADDDENIVTHWLPRSALPTPEEAVKDAAGKVTP